VGGEREGSGLTGVTMKMPRVKDIISGSGRGVGVRGYEPEPQRNGK
jgi:hypothetical protein